MQSISVAELRTPLLLKAHGDEEKKTQDWKSKWTLHLHYFLFVSIHFRGWYKISPVSHYDIILGFGSMHCLRKLFAMDLSSGMQSAYASADICDIHSPVCEVHRVKTDPTFMRL